jgi:hypothetical protein
MKKLNKLELQVVVNEVFNNIKKIEENKCLELFDKSDNKDLFLNKIKEFEDLEEKMNLLRKEIAKIGNKFEEDNLRVYYVDKSNRSFKSPNQSFGMNLLGEKSSGFGFYKEIEKEIILSNLEGLNIRDLISSLVEKFK